jgi:hypothetical protein
MIVAVLHIGGSKCQAKVTCQVMERIREEEQQGGRGQEA